MTNNITATANITHSTVSLPAGFAANLDSLTNPQNYLLATVDNSNGTCKGYLYQILGGAYAAPVISGTITYVAGAALTLAHTVSAGVHTYTLTYNGIQVGTYVVTDWRILQNNLYAKFSTDASGIVVGFSVTGYNLIRRQAARREMMEELLKQIGPLAAYLALAVIGFFIARTLHQIDMSQRELWKHIDEHTKEIALLRGEHDNQMRLGGHEG